MDDKGSFLQQIPCAPVQALPPLENRNLTGKQMSISNVQFAGDSLLVLMNAMLASISVQPSIMDKHGHRVVALPATVLYFLFWMGSPSKFPAKIRFQPKAEAHASFFLATGSAWFNQTVGGGAGVHARQHGDVHPSEQATAVVSQPQAPTRGRGCASFFSSIRGSWGTLGHLWPGLEILRGPEGFGGSAGVFVPSALGRQHGFGSCGSHEPI